MGNGLKRVHFILNVLVWIVVSVGLVLLLVYHGMPADSVEANSFFYDIVFSFTVVVSIVLFFMVPIILVSCFIATIQVFAGESDKKVVQVIKLFALLVATLISVVTYASVLVNVTGGV